MNNTLFLPSTDKLIFGTLLKEGMVTIQKQDPQIHLEQQRVEELSSEAGGNDEVYQEAQK